MANQPPQVPPPEVAFQAELQDMAMEIYCRLVAKHIANRSEKPVGLRADPDELRNLAIDARIAAKAYFESMGVTFPS